MRTPPRSSLRLAASALLAAALAVGCSTSRPPSGHTASISGSPADEPVRVCTELVAFWAKTLIRGGPGAGLDWEQKGMSIDQHAIHEDVVAAARVEQKQQGSAAAMELIERQTRARCTAERGAEGGGEH
ncbi:hypothetical protein AB0M39_29940 [Streptomyces sp. NPDC051907]|uniref:hypothetical protein n=1 Tax=Streptomyces sp. NPDC051907 TaxID=3155284 RepID=UPI00343A930C